MNGWDMLLAFVASYVAVVSLVRLMANRRNELVEKIRKEIDKQRAGVDAESDIAEEAA